MILQLELLLTLPNILTWSSALFLLWYLTTAAASYLRLRHIPGPFFSRISYLPHLYTILTTRLKLAYEPIHGLYQNSPFIVIAPGTVVTNDPDALRHIAAARSTYKRDDWYRAAKFHREFDSIASIIDTEEHDRAKARTASGYSGREVGTELEPAIDAVIASLLELIRRKYLRPSLEGKEGVDISFLLRLFTVDVITRLGYGRSFGHLDEGEDVYGFLTETEKTYRPASVMMEMPLLRRAVYQLGLFSVVAPREGDEKGAGRIMG